MAAGTVAALLPGLGGAEVVPGREAGAGAGEDDDADGVVRLGVAERPVELDQEAAALRVADVGAVQSDPRDAPLVAEGLIGEEVEIRRGDRATLLRTVSVCKSRMHPPH